MGDHSSSPSRRRKIKPLARELGVAPNALRKYERSDSPPKRQERPRTRLLDRYETHIDELIHSTPKITAVRITGMRRKTGATPVADEMADGTGEK
jgi:transcriptional regulator with XRE-family HTH domain